MAEAEISVKIRADIADLQKKMKGVETSVSKMSKSSAKNMKASAAASKKLTSGFASLGKMVGGLAIAYAGLKIIKATTAYISESIKMAGNAELQMNKLRAMVKNVGVAYGYTEAQIETQVQALASQAESLQSVTGFSDELTKSAQAMLATFQLTPDQIKEITPRLLDMAAATEKATGEQVDLQAVAIALGKGFTGQVGMLSRYGVVLSEQAKKTGDFNLILKDLDSNFQGAAKAVGETYVGQSRIAQQAIVDMREEMGAKFMPILMDIMPHITQLAEGLQGMVERAEQGVGILAFLGNSVKYLADAFWILSNISDRTSEEMLEYNQNLRDLKIGLTLMLKAKGEEIDKLTVANLMRIMELRAIESSLGIYEAYKQVISETTGAKAKDVKKTKEQMQAEFDLWQLREAEMEAEKQWEAERAAIYKAGIQAYEEKNEAKQESDDEYMKSFDENTEAELAGIKAIVAVQAQGANSQKAWMESLEKYFAKQTDKMEEEGKKLESTLVSMEYAFVSLFNTMKKGSPTMKDLLNLFLSFMALTPGGAGVVPFLRPLMGLLQSSGGGAGAMPAATRSAHGSASFAGTANAARSYSSMAQTESHVTISMTGFANLADPEMQDKLIRVAVKPGLDRYARQTVN